MNRWLKSLTLPAFAAATLLAGTAFADPGDPIVLPSVNGPKAHPLSQMHAQTQTQLAQLGRAGNAAADEPASDASSATGGAAKVAGASRSTACADKFKCQGQPNLPSLASFDKLTLKDLHAQTQHGQLTMNRSSEASDSASEQVPGGSGASASHRAGSASHAASGSAPRDGRMLDSAGGGSHFASHAFGSAHEARFDRGFSGSHLRVRSPSPRLNPAHLPGYAF